MLTVLIATHNGANTLPKVFERYGQLHSPTGGWKLVVVDNGSTDNSNEIIHSFSNRLPLTYLFEPSRGKNAALNTGLASAEGDLIVLTDDDTLPRPDWLIEMRRAADSHPSFSVFAGTVVPHGEVIQEDWIPDWVLGPAFSITDPGWKSGSIGPEQVFGTNMAIRAEVFRSGYRFDGDLGPRGRDYPMGSETELTVRLAHAGFKAWYCKEAVVEHIIRTFQLDRAWILRRAIRLGRGEFRIFARYWKLEPKLWFGIPRYLIREIIEQALCVAGAKLRGAAADEFETHWKLNYLRGQAIEARILYSNVLSGSSVQLRELKVG